MRVKALAGVGSAVQGSVLRWVTVAETVWGFFLVSTRRDVDTAQRLRASCAAAWPWALSWQLPCTRASAGQARSVRDSRKASSKGPGLSCSWLG